MFRNAFQILFRKRSILLKIGQIQQRSLTKHPKSNSSPLLQRSLRWYTIPVSFVASFLIFDELRNYKLKELAKNVKDENDIGKYYEASRFEIFLYEVLPLRLTSRAWGWLNQLVLPEFLREPVLGLYSRTFHCRLDEAAESDLRKYRNLQEFFGRTLKPGVREIEGDGIGTLVSPSDGKVVHFGTVKNGRLEQVKGVAYAIDDFLGPQTWISDENQNNSSTSVKKHLRKYQKDLLHNKTGETQLYHCIIYLAPGDYHRYHSPSDWKVRFRRHFAGKLYSVRPSFAIWFPNLFSLNERVAYIGEWHHGFFSMVPVGATNVGSMKMHFDPELSTNQSLKFKFDHRDKNFETQPSFLPGDPFGQFKLGSTIVLIFEAPKNFQFTIQRGDSLKYGQAIGNLDALKA